VIVTNSSRGGWIATLDLFYRSWSVRTPPRLSPCNHPKGLYINTRRPRVARRIISQGDGTSQATVHGHAGPHCTVPRCCLSARNDETWRAFLRPIEGLWNGKGEKQFPCVRTSVAGKWAVYGSAWPPGRNRSWLVDSAVAWLGSAHVKGGAQPAFHQYEKNRSYLPAWLTACNS
jgi:hypothetical protein